MDKYYLRAVRIAAKNKLSDRWIHSQWYQPLDAEDAGTTFVLIEVVNPWFPAPQITTTITNTFNREYFRQRRVASATDSFETAVRKVNESLAARAEEGETDWIGSLHAILAVVSGTELHIVQTGKGLAYIFRDGVVNPVIEPKPTDDPPSPLNTFVNITTGSLEPGDKGVLSTPDLANYVSLEQLGASLTQPVDTAAKEVVKLLQAQKVKTPHAVLFDFSATPHPERLSAEAETVFVDVPLVGGLSRAKHIARNVIAPAISSSAKATGSAAAWFWGKTKSDIFPRLKGGLNRVAQRGKKQVTSAAEQVQPIVSSAVEQTKEVAAEVSSKAEGLDQTAVVAKPANFLANLLNRLSSIARSVNLRSRLFFVALILVIVGVLSMRLITISRERDSRAAQEQAQNSLAVAQAKKQEADLALVYNEPDRAVDLYIEAIKLASEAKKNPRVAQTADEVFVTVQKKLDELTKTTRIDKAEPVATYAHDPKKFVPQGEIFWAANDRGDVHSPSDKLSIAGSGEVVGIASIAETSRLFLVGRDGVGMINASESSGSLLNKPEGGWQPAIVVDFFGTTLYFLDAEAGQIWKYTTSSNGIAPAPPTKYFAEAQNLAEAIDLAIDGNIYVLFGDGTINKYFKGVAQTFTLAGLPKPNERLISPKLLASDSEVDALFVYDQEGKRIVELDQSGAYRRQFALPEEWDIKDIQVSGGNNKLYILAGSNLYEIKL